MSGRHILIVTQHYGLPVSGMGTYATELVRGLVEHGHTVSLITDSEAMPDDGPVLRRRLRVAGSRWDIMPYRWLSIALAAERAVRQVVAEDPPDLIHYCDARFASVARRRPVPTVGTLHDHFGVDVSPLPWAYCANYPDGLQRWLYYWGFHAFERLASRRLDRLITVSDYIRRRLGERGMAGGTPVEVVHPCCPPPPPSPPAEAVPRLEGEPRLLFIGGNFPGKGLPAVIRAVAALHEEYPDITLAVVGKSRQEAPMRQLAARLGVDRRLVFLGWLPNPVVRAVLRQASVFVMPSYFEGWGIVFSEAMSEDVPVIGTKRGGTPELICDGWNGFTVDPNDDKVLAERIRSIIEDPILRQKFIHNGRSRLLGLTATDMVNGTITAYERALHQQSC